MGGLTMGIRKELMEKKGGSRSIEEGIIEGRIRIRK